MNPSSSDERLIAGLEVLARRDPGVLERLLRPAAVEHLDLTGDAPAILLSGTRTGLALPSVAREALVARALEGTNDLLLFGAGDARLVETLLRVLPRDRTITVWDRDPVIIQELLARLEDPTVLSRRLHLALGADLVPLRERCEELRVIDHPLAREIYACEWRFLNRSPRARRAFVLTGGLYVHSLETALERADFDVLPMPAEGLSIEEHRHAMATFQPEFLAGINYTEGLAPFAEDLRTEVLIWEIDPSSTPPRPEPRGSQRVHLFTYRRPHVRSWKQAGFPNVQWMPLAADEHLRRPTALTEVEHRRYAAKVSFVGSSMGVNEGPFTERLLLALANHRRANDPGAQDARVLDAVLGAQAGAGHDVLIGPTFEAERPGFLAWAKEHMVEDPLVLAGELTARAHRIATVRALGPQGIEVWGDAGWEAVDGSGATWRGPAGHARELTRIYAASDINLDIGRVFQNDIVTMRVFDIMAAGGFLIAAWSDDLPELFDVGEEIVCWHDPAELVELVKHYGSHPEDRRTLAQRGRQAVLERHAFDRRVQDMLVAMRPLDLTLDTALD